MKQGIYIGARISQKTHKNLLNFCKIHNIYLNTSDFDKRLHTTIITSKQYSEFEIDHNFSCLALPSHFSVFRNNKNNGNCLVLELASPDLHQLHKKIKEDYKLNHVFNDYNPHLTLDYNFEGMIPLTLPNFPIEIEKLYKKIFLL